MKKASKAVLSIVPSDGLMKEPFSNFLMAIDQGTLDTVSTWIGLMREGQPFWGSGEPGEAPTLFMQAYGEYLAKLEPKEDSTN